MINSKKIISEKYFRVVAILIIAVVLILGVRFFDHHSTIIPSSIGKQITYRVYWPNSPNSTTDKKTIKYSPSNGIISFITYTDNVKTTITEQATPSEFTDIPNYYSALINHLNNYDTISTANGTVYLTKPSNVTGETAVLNNSGTLIFDHASSNIDENNWRQLFNNLKVVLN